MHLDQVRIPMYRRAAPWVGLGGLRGVHGEAEANCCIGSRWICSASRQRDSTLRMLPLESVLISSRSA